MRSDLYEAHHGLEDVHWWFTARRSIVLKILQRELKHWPAETALRIADVGCGAGGLLPHLREFGTVVGVDSASEAVVHAEKTGSDVRRGSLPDDLPFGEGELFHVITLLDVLEHVERDTAALESLRNVLVPDGRLILTVPAGQALWSAHDEANHHYRRYSRRDLRTRLEEAGFRVAFLSYYNSALFVPIAGVRLLQRVLRPRRTSHDFVRLPSYVNGVLHSIFAAERFVLGRGTLPFGVSLIAVAVPLRPAPALNHATAQ